MVSTLTSRADTHSHFRAEADVFMAERDPGDIARNELVSSKTFPVSIGPTILTNPSLPPRTRIFQRDHLPNHQPLLHHRRSLPLPSQYPPPLHSSPVLITSSSLAEIPVSSPSRRCKAKGFEERHAGIGKVGDEWTRNQECNQDCTDLVCLQGV
jgi:hypothetical protein